MIPLDTQKNARKNGPRKNGPQEKWSPEKWSPEKFPSKIVLRQKNARKFKRLFHFYQLIPLHTHKNVWRLSHDPTYVPNFRTLKESRKICCRVLGFHRLITSEHSAHTPRCLTLTPRFFVSKFWVCFRVLGFHRLITSEHSTHIPRRSMPTSQFFVCEFPGNHFSGDHFSRGPFFWGPFFRGPFFPGTIFRGSFFRDSWIFDFMNLRFLWCIQINEAFGAQTLSCIKDLGLDINKVNVNGGAIALGHPLAASGSRITAHIIHELK